MIVRAVPERVGRKDKVEDMEKDVKWKQGRYNSEYTVKLRGRSREPKLRSYWSEVKNTDVRFNLLEWGCALPYSYVRVFRNGTPMSQLSRG